MEPTAFLPGNWQTAIDVRDFIQKNVTPYHGDASFLAGPTERTRLVNDKYLRLKQLENEFGGCLDIDTTTVSSLLTYKPGYLDREHELIVGLQTKIGRAHV